jgi:glutaredoxin
MNTPLSHLPEMKLGTASHLRLYNLEYCSYCRKVEREAQKLGILLEMIDVYREPALRARLFTATGRTRVPVLGIIDENGQEHFLPESEHIIRFLHEHGKARPRS